MSEQIPSVEHISSLLAKINALIGLSAKFPPRRSEIRVEDTDDEQRYRLLWSDVDRELSIIRSAGFPISNPNLHADIKSMWAWCISLDGSWGTLRAKPRELHIETIEYLTQLKQVVANADAPLEVQRELRESARRTNELFAIMAFRPETNEFRQVVKEMAVKVGLSPVIIDEAEPENAISEATLSSIRRSTLVLCDLSFERPNCYFEAGFAKGAMRRILFSCRADHDPRKNTGSPHRVHFDVDQFKITWWDPGKLDVARAELEGRLRKVLTDIGRN